MPLFLGLAFKVSASHLFFSLMAGELLARYFGRDIDSLAGAAGAPLSASTAYGELALLVMPLLLTAIFLRATLARGKVVLHLLPLAITGVIFSAFVLPQLPESSLNTISSTQLGDWLLHLNRVIVGSVVIIQLVALWLLNNRRAPIKRKNRD